MKLPALHGRCRYLTVSTLLLLMCAGAVINAGAANSGLAFDGVNDYVTFGPAPGLGAQTFTIETWFKRTGAGVGTSTGYGGVDSAIPLVTKGRAEVDGDNRDMNYFLGIRATDNVLVADFEEGATGVLPGQNHPVAGHTPISNNAWYHAAATYDGTKWQLFLNGTLEAELAVGQPPRADSIQHAALGSAIDSTGVAAGFFNGVLDEARIWNYARSAQQIADNRSVEITTAPGLIGRWGLNEGSGTVATDSSGDNINGALTNGPVWTTGFQQSGSVTVVRGPYLQRGTPNSVIVRWRTDVATDSRVRFGTSAASLTLSVSSTTSATSHELQLTGLTADTQYFYSVGTSATTLAAGADYTFFTAPAIGTAHATRIWAIGCSGEANGTAAAVRDGYTKFAAGRYTDVWLMLGDNAYENGTDAEYQSAVFDTYPAYLRQSVLWPALGNHDTANLTNPDITTVPYFSIFSLPTRGEAGGVASGTEKYYSFDYGRIHFICLDSMTSSRQPGSPMLTWLQNDLAATRQDWIIAYWHHPPYSRGNSNSDVEIEGAEMRQNVVPILEAGGVDLVLCAHSHCYERSYLINGHYGLSNTFSSQNIINGGSGRENLTGVYRKPADLAANQGAVYVVAGSSSDLSWWTGGSTAEFNPTPYPAMYYSALHTGSLVLDVDGDRLDAKMIRETGVVDDYFTIVKNIANQPPSVSIASPAEGATFTAPATITITASATDSDGTISQVDFYSGNTAIGTDTIAPYSMTWSSVPAGTYSLTAVATDNLGATKSSVPVSITVNPAKPSAPSSLMASAVSRSQINLTWKDNSSNESGFRIEQSTDNKTFNQTATVGANINTFSKTGLKANKAYYYRIRAYNAGGSSGYSNTAGATTLH